MPSHSSDASGLTSPFVSSQSSDAGNPSPSRSSSGLMFVSPLQDARRATMSRVRSGADMGTPGSFFVFAGKNDDGGSCLRRSDDSLRLGDARALFEDAE